MRVLQIYRDLGWGGIQSHIRSLVNGLVKGGDQVIFAGPGKGWLFEELRSAGVECIDIPMRGLYDPRSHMRLIKLLSSPNIDLVHSHGRRATFYASFASRLTSTPHVATAHSTNTWKSFVYPKRVIAISNAIADNLKNHGVEPDRIRIVRHGIDNIPNLSQSERDEYRKRLHLNTGEVAIGLSGRFIKDKGHDLLLRSVCKLEKDTSHVKIFFLGADNSEFCQELRGMCEELGLSAMVDFIPYQKHILPFLMAMDILAIPSRREGLSLSLLEAASCGLAIVGSNVGGIPEVIEDGVTGLLFESDDVETLASRLDLLISNERLRYALGGKARRLVRNNLSIESMIESTKNVYTETISSHAS